MAQFEKSRGRNRHPAGAHDWPGTHRAYSIRVRRDLDSAARGIDDGILVLVDRHDHQLRIEVGRGLEGAPCCRGKAHHRETMLPRFGSGDYFGGLQDGVSQTKAIIAGEPLPSPRKTCGALPPPVPGGHPAAGHAVRLPSGGLLRALFGSCSAARWRAAWPSRRLAAARQRLGRAGDCPGRVLSYAVRALRRARPTRHRGGVAPAARLLRGGAAFGGGGASGRWWAFHSCSASADAGLAGGPALSCAGLAGPVEASIAASKHAMPAKSAPCGRRTGVSSAAAWTDGKAAGSRGVLAAAGVGCRAQQRRADL
ncbi:MAG: TPM domain-containing protein [Rhodocyclales bacterium]|nr:TPM domain-containing protein [Rhodocyclales bacterium]